jgi:MFS transporter, DHA1 family, tetracycline resistance protein
VALARVIRNDTIIDWLSGEETLDSSRHGTGTMPTKQPAAISFVLATVAIDGLSFGIVAPVLPDLVRQVDHTSQSGAAFWMGLLLATFAAMQFIFSPVQGGLSDHYGRRPVLLISLAGTCVTDTLLAWAPTLPWLFLGQIITGGTTASMSTATAYIADTTPPATRAQRFGLLSSAFALGFVLGPALGGLCGHFWIRLPFVLAAALTGGNALYGWFLLPESLPFAHRRPLRLTEVNPVGVWRGLSFDKDIIRLAVAWCCIGVAFGAQQSAFVLANQMRLNWDMRQNGAALVALGVGAALVQTLLLPQVLRRIGSRSTALISFGLSSVSYVLLAFAYEGWVVFSSILFQALGTMSTPAIQALGSARAGPARQGAVQGAFASLRGLTAIAAPFAAGSLLGVCSNPGFYFPGAPFLLVAATYLVGFVVLRDIAPTAADVSGSSE